MKKVERTDSDRGVHWTITGKDKAWIDVHYTYGSPNLLVLNYGPRGGHRGVVVLPLAMLDELITLARDRPDLDLETTMDMAEQITNDANREDPFNKGDPS